MTTAMKELEGLKSQEQALKERQRELTEKYHVAHGGSPDAAKKRDSIIRDLRTLAEEQGKLSGQICAAKESAKRQRVADLLASTQYHNDVKAAVEALGFFLGPWLPLVATCRAVPTAPPLPDFIGLAAVGGAAWLKTMLRLGGLSASDVPEVLRSLVEVKQ